MVIFGGHLQGPWGCAQEEAVPWRRPRVHVPGVTAPIAPEETDFVGDGCQRLEVLLPPEARSGSLVVSVERAVSGETVRSTPYALELSGPR